MFTQHILIENDDFILTSAVESHGWAALAPFHYEDETLTRVHRMNDGRIVRLSIRQTGNTSRANFLLLESEGDAHSPDQLELAGTVRTMLCMDWDLRPFYDLVRDLPEYDWVEPMRAGVMLRAPSVWEDLAKTLLTTNTTWRQTIGMVQRLNDLGTASEFGAAFPIPEQVAAFAPEDLTAQVKCGYRGAYLHQLASRIVSGEIEVEAWAVEHMPAPDLYKRITALKGFGAYAAGNVMRLLGYHEFLGIDSVAREVFAHLHNGGQKAPDDKAIQQHYEAFGEWRGMVLWMDVLRYYWDRLKA